jgi:hypothetical protein
VLRPSWVDKDVKRKLTRLFRFNRDLDRNAHLSRLNEKYLEQRIDWLKSASPSDRALMRSRLLRLDWRMFWELGSLIYRVICPLFGALPLSPGTPPD